MARMKKKLQRPGLDREGRGPSYTDIKQSNYANLNMLREALGSTIMIGRRADVTAQGLIIDLALVEDSIANGQIKVARKHIEKALSHLRMADSFTSSILNSVSGRSAKKVRR